MFLGREIPARACSGWFGFMDNKAMRAQARSGFDRLGRHRAQPDLAGRQRCPAASARRSPSPGPWTGPTGWSSSTSRPRRWACVQTANVSTRSAGSGRPGHRVVFISHSMPHVIEVSRPRPGPAARPPGRHLPDQGHHVEELVGAMTGALDGSERMSAARTPPQPKPRPHDAASRGRPSASHPEAGTARRLLRGAGRFQILLVLVVIVAVFATLAPASFRRSATSG